MPPVSQMDANSTRARIFQERTNFKNLQGHNRVDWCIVESVTALARPLNALYSDTHLRSIPKSGTTQQENSDTVLSGRRKSERKMLRRPLVSDPNLWHGPVDVVLPAQELGTTNRDEPLNGPIEPSQGPIHLPLRSYNEHQRSQRVRADHTLLSSFSSPQAEAEADHKLKVAALNRVTSSLAAKASDAKQGVERLRKLLADRAVEPSIYEATQRERWMEERRQVATEELLSTVRNHLSSLVKSPARESTPTTEHDNVSAVAANLHVFLTTPHRSLIHSSSRRRRPYSESRPEDSFNRIRHHKQLLPLRLKVPVHRPFSQPPPKAKQVLATGAGNLSPTAQLSASTESTATNTTSPTTSSGVHLDFHSPAPSPASLLGPIPENQEEVRIPFPEIPPSLPNGNGMATIWRTAAPRSKEEILAGVDMDTDMPDYVQNLLAELDSTPVARVRLNTLRRSASFPRRPPSTAAVGRTPKRNSNAGASSNHTKRFTASHARPGPASQSPNMPPPTPTNANASSNDPPHVHTSPSKHRISALFSLPDMLSSRRSLNTVHTHSPPANLSSPSAQLPALALVSPSIGFTIMESSQETEERDGGVDVDGTGDTNDGDVHAPVQQPLVAPIPPSTSAITLSSVGTARDARRSSIGVSAGNTEERILARLRRRMSAAFGR